GLALDIAARALARVDQRVVAQPRQRLAHHRPRDPEPGTELRLGRQLAVLRKLAADDQREDLLVDAVAELAATAIGTLGIGTFGISAFGVRSACLQRIGLAAGGARMALGHGRFLGRAHVFTTLAVSCLRQPTEATGPMGSGRGDRARIAARPDWPA